MKSALLPLLSLAALLSPAPAKAADDPVLNLAYQDHIAYVATFVLPVIMEKCAAIDPAYTQKAAPLYFRYVNARQDQIERGRLLTLAGFGPADTVAAYRERTLAQRLGRLDTGTPEQKQQACEGALAMLTGKRMPGEWPPRD